MEDTVTQKMAQLLIDISETNSEILKKLEVLKNDNTLLKARIEKLEPNGTAS
jgi:hypothetical protein